MALILVAQKKDFVSIKKLFVLSALESKLAAKNQID